MTKHSARIVWNRTTENFDYEGYNRDHEWQFEGGIVINASAAPKYKGNPDLVDPEEAFVASLSSCHMLTFLAVASLKKIVINSYEDLAEGVLEKSESGKLCMTKVVLRPVVKVGEGVEVQEEVFQEMHDKAHRECFIANSVTTQIIVEPKLVE